MPVFELKCNSCGAAKRVLRPGGWTSSQEAIKCPRCQSGTLERDPQGMKTGTIVKETIDNGAMVKRLERFADAERLHADRVEIEDALAKGKDPGRPIR